MINSVRNTVLSILNKNNYGYITPADFNSYSKLAQIDIFTSSMGEYTNQIKRQNKRMSGENYTDIAKFIKNNIDTFSENNFLTQSAANVYFLPSTATQGHELYYLNKVAIYSSSVYVGTSEEVTHNVVDELLTSLDNQPTVKFPIHTVDANSITVYPSTITGASDVKAQYIRMPKDPKWTYTTLTNGEAVFNQSNVDYQDFEISVEHFTDLVEKILQYAGLEIRETEVHQTAANMEQMDKIEQSQQ